MFKTNYENWDEVGHGLRKCAVNASMVNNLMMIQSKYGADLPSLERLCSKGQLMSKSWLSAEFPWDMVTRNPKVYLCAGWYGSLVPFFCDQLYGNYEIVSIDVDPDTEQIANALNAEDFKKDRFKAVVGDVTKETFEDADLVINTSCEHIENLTEWYDTIPKDTVVVLQSNNYRANIAEHVNCVDSPDELLQQCPMGFVKYKGTLTLPDYERYMLVGIK